LYDNQIAAKGAVSLGLSLNFLQNLSKLKIGLR